MESYMQQGVKEIIETFPEVGNILERHAIACVACMVGTCKLGDVVRIHSLPPEDESSMMAEIEQAIHPNRGAPRAAIVPCAEPAGPREITYSPPVRRLVDEHAWIKRLLALIPALVEDMRASGQTDVELARGVVDFIRGYADRFHHMKEEDVLFDYADREADVIRVIYEDHDRARALVRGAAEAIEDGDISTLCANLMGYRELLTEHIEKEDQVLYPYIDRGLTTHQVGQISQRFGQAASEAEADVPEKYERFITELEREFEQKELDRCHTIVKDAQVPA